MDHSHELTIIIGQMAAFRCDMGSAHLPYVRDMVKIEEADVYRRIDEMIESLTEVRNSIEEGAIHDPTQ